MPILALTNDTVRLLKSSGLLTSPASIVKELLDNALDAHATSVVVKISRNALDLILVGDNGNGISAGDIDALGRRAHTSKLKRYDELTHLGGSSLGFRGEALASANSVGEVTITTKTSQDAVGHMIKLTPNKGGVAEVKPAPSGVGTTVEIRGLFRRLPVRSTQYQKEAKKSITLIKNLLHSYAFSRPNVRYSFRVDGEPKACWNYSPTTSLTVQEVGLHAFGKDFSSQCILEKVKEEATPADRVIEEITLFPVKLYAMEAFLPKLDADLQRICNKGAFISVDSRPMAINGLMKKILQEFRSKLKACLPGQDLVNPFMRLNIICPPGSYDVNVAPSKDEVIFLDEQRVLNLASRLFSAVYATNPHEGDYFTKDDIRIQCSGNLSQDVFPESEAWLNAEETIRPGPTESIDQVAIGATAREGTSGLLELLENKNKGLGSSSDDGMSESHKNSGTESMGFEQKCRPILSGWAVDMAEPCEREDLGVSETGNAPILSVIDQLHRAAAAQKSTSTTAEGKHTQAQGQNSEGVIINQPQIPVERLPTPSQQASLPSVAEDLAWNPFTISPGHSIRKKSHTRDADRTDAESGSSILLHVLPVVEAQRIEKPRPSVRPLPGLLQPGMHPHENPTDFGPGPGVFSSQSLLPSINQSGEIPNDCAMSPDLRGNFARFIPPLFYSQETGVPIFPSPPSSHEKPKQGCASNSTFKPSAPVIRGALTRRKEDRQKILRRHANHTALIQKSHAHEFPTLSEREKVGLDLRNEPLETQSSLTSPTPFRLTYANQSDVMVTSTVGDRIDSPLLKTKNAPLAVPLTKIIQEGEMVSNMAGLWRRPTSMSRDRSRGRSTARTSGTRPLTVGNGMIKGKEDPRTFLMKRQNSIARDKTGKKALRRVQSGLLPLETSSRDEQLQEIEQELALTVDLCGDMVEKIIPFDLYVSAGTCEAGLPQELAVAESIQTRLRSIFRRWAKREMGTKCDLELDFKTMVKGKFKA